MLKATHIPGATLQPQGKEPGQRDTTKNHGRLDGIRQTLPAMTYSAETWTFTKQAQNKFAAAQTKMERSSSTSNTWTEHLGQRENRIHNQQCEKLLSLKLL